MNQLAQAPAIEYLLTVVSGPERGATYKLRSQSITLGRDPSCEIVIQADSKCSRRHATLTFTPQGLKITAVNEQKVVEVDGQEVSETFLRNGSIFRLGRTKLQFKIQAPGGHNLPAFGHGPALGGPAPSPRRQKKSSPLFYIIILIAGGGLAWLLTSSKNPPKEEVELLTDTVQEAELQKLKAMEEEITTSGLSDTQMAAREYWITGFRDYRKGLYESARTNFSACRSLDPKNHLCISYERKAQAKFDELVQYHLIQGTKFRDQNQFAACMASFRNVVNMVKDRNDPKFIEAKRNYVICREKMRDQY